MEKSTALRFVIWGGWRGPELRTSLSRLGTSTSPRREGGAFAWKHGLPAGRKAVILRVAAPELCGSIATRPESTSSVGCPLCPARWAVYAAHFCCLTKLLLEDAHLILELLVILRSGSDP